MTISKLGTDIQTGQIVELPQASRRQGLYIIGANGTGKTGLIENLVMQDINQGLGVGVLDPHGDLTNAILAKMTKRLDDVILLDIAEFNSPFGLNLFTCSDPTNLKIVSEASNKVMHVFKKLWGKGGIVVEDAWGVLLEEILGNATMTFLECSQYEAYTMAEIPLLLENETFRNHLAQKLTFRHVKNYWLNKYNAFSDKDQLAERRSTLNRVNAFLRQPLVENIVGQAKTTINFRRIMDERKILLVMLDRRMEDVTSLIGSMIIAEFLDAAYSRESLPIDKRKQFNLYADEFQLFATEDFATLLTEARKFGIATTIAHQIRDQLDLQNRSATLNVANLVVFKISGKDAEELSAEFRIAPPSAETRREAVLTHKQNVIDHLLQQGHESAQVQEFVTKYLQVLQRAAAQEIDKSPMGLQITKLHYTKHPVIEYPGGEVYAYDPEELKEGLRLLNNMLFQEMSGSNDTSLHVEYEKPNAIVKAFSSFLGFPHYYQGYFESEDQPDFGETMGNTLFAGARKARQLLYEFNNKLKNSSGAAYDALKEQKYQQAERVLDYHAKYLIYREMMRQGYQGYQVGTTIEIYGDKLFTFGYKGHYTEEELSRGKVVIDIYLREFDRAYDFYHLLESVVHHLKIWPIMAESGRYEEKPLAPRTYADVQKEIATTLANLPRFTARVKIATDLQTVEHTVKTLTPEQGIGRTALEQRKSTIKVQNLQHGYNRHRKEVEEEIANRQNHFSLSSPKQPQLQQQPPRHARQVPVQGNCPNCGFSNNPPGARFCMQCGTKLQ